MSAQELQKLYPDLVMEGEDGYLSVNYPGLVPLLLRSIQELKAELDEVKGNGKAPYVNASGSESKYAGIVDAQGRMLRKTR